MRSGAVARLVLDRERLAAGVMLLAALLAQVIVSAAFDPWRFALFDAYERISPRQRTTDPVLIVAIDDDSLAAVGQWPWPRHLEARLIDAILAGKPAALGIDILWPEPDRTSPVAWLREQGDVPDQLRTLLLQQPDHDALLRAALASGPVAIGVAGTRDQEPGQAGRLAPARISGDDPSPFLPRFSGALRSLPDLDDAAPGHGLLSVDLDPDGTVRRVPTLSDLNGRLAPSLGLEIVRLAAHSPWFDVIAAPNGLRSVKAGPVTIPTQPDGSVWVDFTSHDPRRFVSAADVLAGKVAADLFTDRLVLLGVTGLGLVDMPMTPLGRMPGVEVHAQFLEIVADGRFATRPGWARAAETALGAALGILLILALPRLRPRWYGLAFLVPCLALTAGGLAAWHRQRWLLDAVTPAADVALVALMLLGASFVEADAQRRRLRREVEIHKMEAARIEGELQAARRIQLGILPDPAALRDPRFDLDARVIPAREVGGDLYDFFMIDENRLYFAVGDVTGKGVPASLFMAIGKALCKSCALRGDAAAVGHIVAEANEEISRDNPEMLFITMFAGILDLSTGEIDVCNAGHDAPIVVRHGTLVGASGGEGGPPLCVVEGFPYPDDMVRLQPGDLLCLFTDGATEAMNRDGALMGREHAEQALQALPADAGAADAVRLMCETVAAFADGAEQSDDLTVLAIRWFGAVKP